MSGCNAKITTTVASNKAKVRTEISTGIGVIVSDIESALNIILPLNDSDDIEIKFDAGTFSAPLSLVLRKHEDESGIGFSLLPEQPGVTILHQYKVILPKSFFSRNGFSLTEKNQILRIVGLNGESTSVPLSLHDGGPFQFMLSHFVAKTFFVSSDNLNSGGTLRIKEGKQTSSSTIHLIADTTSDVVAIKIYDSAACTVAVEELPYSEEAIFSPKSLARDFAFYASTVDSAGTVSLCEKLSIEFLLPPVIKEALYTLSRADMVLAFNVLSQVTSPQPDLQYAVVGVGPFATSAGGVVKKTTAGWTYIPVARFLGKDSITMSVVDPVGRQFSVKSNFLVTDSPLTLDILAPKAGVLVRQDQKLEIKWMASDKDDVRRIFLSVADSPANVCSKGELVAEAESKGVENVTLLDLNKYAGKTIYLCIFDAANPKEVRLSPQVTVRKTPSVSFVGLPDPAIFSARDTHLSVTLGKNDFLTSTSLKGWIAGTSVTPATCFQNKLGSVVAENGSNLTIPLISGLTDFSVCVEISDVDHEKIYTVLSGLKLIGLPQLVWGFPGENNPVVPRQGLKILWNYSSETPSDDQIQIFAHVTSAGSCESGVPIGATDGNLQAQFAPNTGALVSGGTYWLCAVYTDVFNVATSIWAAGSLTLSDSLFMNLVPQAGEYLAGHQYAEDSSGAYLATATADYVDDGIIRIRRTNSSGTVETLVHSYVTSSTAYVLGLTSVGGEIAVVHCESQAGINLTVILPDNSFVTTNLVANLSPVYLGICPGFEIKPVRYAGKWIVPVTEYNGGTTSFSTSLVQIDSVGTKTILTAGPALAEVSHVPKKMVAGTDRIYALHQGSPTLLSVTVLKFDGTSTSTPLSTLAADGNLFPLNPVLSGSDLFIFLRTYDGTKYGARTVRIPSAGAMESEVVSTPLATSTTFNDAISIPGGYAALLVETLDGKTRLTKVGKDLGGSFGQLVPLAIETNTVIKYSKLLFKNDNIFLAVAENSGSSNVYRLAKSTVVSHALLVDNFLEFSTALVPTGVIPLIGDERESLLIAGAAYSKYSLRYVSKVGSTIETTVVVSDAETAVVLVRPGISRLLFVEKAGKIPSMIAFSKDRDPIVFSLASQVNLVGSCSVVATVVPYFSSGSATSFSFLQGSDL